MGGEEVRVERKKGLREGEGRGGMGGDEEGEDEGLIVSTQQ